MRFAMWAALVSAALVFPTPSHGAPFSDALVQPPTLAAPQRGTLAGTAARFALGPSDLSRGAFTLPLPLDAPDARGPLLARIAPSYAADAGLGEWGMGWQADLAIRRHRARGEINFLDDDFTSPWGRLVAGDDGAYYPAGLASVVRAVPSAGGWVVETGDGAHYTFAATDAVAAPGGVYAWMLSRVDTAAGDSTTLSWQRNPSGRAFLAEARWGGRGDGGEYRARFDYEALTAPMVSYVAGAPVQLDRRVIRVTFEARVAAAYATRWRYDLAYQASPSGPAFYLQRLTRTFASGSSEPAITYDYDLNVERFAAARIERAPALDSLLVARGPSVIAPDHGALADVDQDGLVDLEVATDLATARQTPTGFVVEPLPAAPGASARCRPAPSAFNAPRTLARMHGDAAEPHVVVTSGSAIQTSILVCDRRGVPVLDGVAPGFWVLGPNVRLADVDHDLRPDLVAVGSGAVSVLRNVATSPTAIAFAPGPTTVLSPALAPIASWVLDVNGDGRADLIERIASGLVVWRGRGDGTFEPTGAAYPFTLSSGLPLASLTGFQLSFGDYNGDGLVDAMLSQNQVVAVFTNRGAGFTQVAVPGVEGIPWVLSPPVIADLAGTGEEVAMFANDTQGMAIALTSPSTGLLRGLDDGRGTTVRFSYGRAAPAPGTQRRHSVLTALTVASSGYDPVTFTYAYGAPVWHSDGKYLLGFAEVDKRGPSLREVLQLHHDDDIAGLPTSSESIDDRTPGIIAFARHTYADARFHAVRWLRPTATETGHHSPDGRVSLSTTVAYGGFARERCPTVVTTTTPSGTLTRSTSLAQVAALRDDLHCLPASESLIGAHADAARDFLYTAVLERDGLGALTRATQYAPLLAPLVLQEVGYTADHRVASAGAPGRGTTTYGYDALGRLTQVTDPAGVITRADGRDAVTDDVVELRTDRPGAAVRAFFAFDGRERLAATWDDVSGASSTRPLARFTYQDATASAPGRIDADALADALTGAHRQTATLVAADGEALITATWLGDHYMAGLATTSTRATLTQRTAFVGVLSATALAALSSDDVRALGTPLAEVVHAGFGHAIQTTTVVQAGVTGVATAEQLLTGAEQITRTHDAAGNVSEAAVDSSGVITRKTDALGVVTRYAYDALGRVVRIDTPDGAHSLTYDGLGRAARVARAGVGAITYTYDPVSGLASHTERLDAAGVLVDAHDLHYDPIGRAVAREDHTPSEASSISFDYDGQLDGATVAGQLGRLTRARGDGWSRTERYDALGRPVQTRHELTGWRTVTHERSFRSDGSVATDEVTIADAGGATRLRVRQAIDLDPLGRPARVLVNGAPLYTLTYDAEGRLARADFTTGEAVTFDHDAVTHQVRGYQVSGPDASGGATWERDPRGLTARETFTTNGAPRVRDYTYDARGALATVTSAGELATYSYTASGLPSTTGDLAGVRTVHDGAVGGWLGAPGGPGGGGGGGGDPPTDAMRSLGATATSRVAASPALRAAVGGDATATGAAWLGASAAVRAKVGGAARGVRTAPRAGSTLTPRALDSAVEPRDASASASALGAPAASTPTLTSVRLLTVGDSTYAFDAAGRVVGRDGREFTYGANGQLRHATVGSRAIDYTYDDADQRILKRVNSVPVRAEVAGGVLTEDHFVELVAIGGVVVGVLDNGVFSTLPTDPRGTPLTGLDGATNLASAYGVRQVHAAGSEVIDYARLGWDADLEVVRMGVRDYDPLLGQFWTPDPLYFADLGKCQDSPIQCNLYGYAGGNPISFVDPTGMQAAPRILPVSPSPPPALPVRPPLTLVPPAPAVPAAAESGAAGATIASVLTPTALGVAAGLVVLLKPSELGDSSCRHGSECERRLKEAVNLDTGAIINATQLSDLSKLAEIHRYLSDKRPIVTYAALDEFFNGGPGKKDGAYVHAGYFERIMVGMFLASVEIQRNNPSARVLDLAPVSNNQRKALGLNDKVIFGTGDRLGQVTATTDNEFVKAARVLGVDLMFKRFLPADYSGR